MKNGMNTTVHRKATTMVTREQTNKQKENKPQKMNDHEYKKD